MKNTHQNIKIDNTLEIDENNYARNLFGLNPKENFVIGFGSVLVEDYIRNAYITNNITPNEWDGISKQHLPHYSQCK